MAVGYSRTRIYSAINLTNRKNAPRRGKSRTVMSLRQSKRDFSASSLSLRKITYYSESWPYRDLRVYDVYTCYNYLLCTQSCVLIKKKTKANQNENQRLRTHLALGRFWRQTARRYTHSYRELAFLSAQWCYFNSRLWFIRTFRVNEI